MFKYKWLYDLQEQFNRKDFGMNPYMRDYLSSAPLAQPKYPGFFRATYRGAVRWIQCGQLKRVMEHTSDMVGRYTTILFQDGSSCTVDQSADEVMALSSGK